MSELNSGAMTGADRLNHSAAIGSAKAARRQAGGISTAHHGRPLFGLGESSAEIIRASGLGRSTHPAKSPGEQMSDANGPTQDVEVTDSGATHRQSVNGGVRETPIGSYSRSIYGDSNGTYQSYDGMPR